MISVNATEFKNNLGQYLQKIYAEPVVINKMGRPTAVLLSYESYSALLKDSKGEEQATLSEQDKALEDIQKAFKQVRAQRAETVR